MREKYVFRTCNVLPFSCTHLPRHKAKIPKVDTKQKVGTKFCKKNGFDIKIMLKSNAIGVFFSNLEGRLGFISANQHSQYGLF